MYTITLNANSSLSDLLSFYEETPSFEDFFTELLNFYQAFSVTLIGKGFFEENECRDIIKFLKTYHNAIIFLSKNDLKKRGSVFTPKDVCRFINFRALYNFTDLAIIKKKFPNILDPSSGLGYFLIDMLFLLVRMNLEENPHELALDLILKCLHGCEINKESHELSHYLMLSIIGIILFLQPFAGTYSRMKKILQKNIILDDFLKTEYLLPMHIIVGNPPYVRVHKIDLTYNTYLRKNYNCAKFDFDLYICFFEKSLSILPKGGILAFITPEKYLLRRYASELRLLFLKNSVPVEFIDVSRCSELFKEFTYPLITVFKKTTSNLRLNPLNYEQLVDLVNSSHPSNAIYYVRTTNFDSELQIKIHSLLNGHHVKVENTLSHKIFNNAYYCNFLNVYEHRFSFILNPVIEELQNLFQNYSKIGELDPVLFCGTPRSKYYHQIKDNLYDFHSNQDPVLKFILSKNIAPYFIFWNLPILFDKNHYTTPWYNLQNGVFSSDMIKRFKKKPKLVIKANSRNLTAAVDNEGIMFVGAYGLLWEAESCFPIDVLCAILNSDLINYYITQKYRSFMLNSRYISINSTIIKDIPLPGKIINNRFESLLPQAQFKDIAKNIVESSITLTQFLKSIYLEGNLQKIRKLKDVLDTSQLNANVERKEPLILELSQIQNLVSKINRQVTTLFCIPKDLQLKCRTPSNGFNRM